MYYIPFIYFTILLIYIIVKRGFDISASITSIYIISTFFSIVIMRLGYAPYIDRGVTFIPTFIFCFCITLTIIPFYLFDSNKIKNIPKLHNIQLFNAVCYLFIFTFFLFLFVLYKDILYALTFSDIGELRGYNEEWAIGIGGAHPLIRPFAYILMPFAEFSHIMFLFFLYSICYLKKTKLFNTLLLLSSMSTFLLAISGIDRSRVFYMIVMFILSYVLFRPRLGKIQKRLIRRISIIFGVILLGYFAHITILRFASEIHEDTTEDSLITYIGQPYLNFCYFFDNYEPAEISTALIFPLTHQHIIKDYKGGVSYGRQVYAETGTDLNVFSSFLGNMTIWMSKYAAIVFCIIFFIICMTVLKRERKIEITFGQIIKLYLLIIIPQLGVIAYYYTTPNRAFAAICLIIIAISFSRKSNQTTNNLLIKH